MGSFLYLILEAANQIPELFGHSVEGTGQVADLVLTLDRGDPVQIAAGNCGRCFGQGADGQHCLTDSQPCKDHKQNDSKTNCQK